MNKKPSKKETWSEVWNDADWRVVAGHLKPGPGRPSKTSHLFKYVAEKLPFDSLSNVRKAVTGYAERDLEGVYLAHDSMGIARYGGRGHIFGRLAAHRRKYPKQLQYYSFYVIANKNHEREIETALLRAAGSQMIFNTKKIASGLETGNVQDYEPGTIFLERKNQGRKPKKA